MKNNPETVPAEDLYLAPYPNSLRSDDKALTYVGYSGNTYVVPLAPHDYELTQKLYAHHLTSGKLVDVPGTGLAVEYSGETDLLSLPALFNASLENEESRSDVVASLKLVGLFIEKAQKIANLNPQDMTIDAFAIDRSNAHAELLPPYTSSVEHVSPAQLLQNLKANVMGRTISEAQAALVDQCFTIASEALGV